MSENIPLQYELEQLEVRQPEPRAPPLLPGQEEIVVPPELSKAQMNPGCVCGPWYTRS